VSERELLPFREWIKLGPGQRMLDCGSGAGRVLSALPPESRARALALDGSQAMLEHLRQALPGVRTVYGDLFTYETAERFDVVTSLRVLDHFGLEDQETLLRRLAGFLAPGGKMVVSVLTGPTLESLANRFARVGKMNYFHTRSAYRRLFERCGLRALRTFNAFVLPRGLLYRLPGALVGAAMAWDRLAGVLLPPLCSYMIVELTAEKSPSCAS